MELTTQRVVQELWAIAFAQVTDILEIREGETVLKDQADCAAIANLEASPKGVKVKFYDKLKALELLGKHLGMFAGTGAEVEDNNLLEAILRATGEEETDDLQPIQHQAADGDQLVEPAEFAEF